MTVIRVHLLHLDLFAKDIFLIIRTRRRICLTFEVLGLRRGLGLLGGCLVGSSFDRSRTRAAAAPSIMMFSSMFQFSNAVLDCLGVTRRTESGSNRGVIDLDVVKGQDCEEEFVVGSACRKSVTPYSGRR